MSKSIFIFRKTGSLDMSLDDFSTNMIMEYLTSRRMSSLGNVALHFNRSVDQLIPDIKALLSAGRLRLSQSRCASGCDSCGGCCASEPIVPALTEQTIVISLEKKETEL
jgi:hypothetical protein